MFRRRSRSVFLAYREASVRAVIRAARDRAVGILRGLRHVGTAVAIVRAVVEVPVDVAAAAVVLRRAAILLRAAHRLALVDGVVLRLDVLAVAAVDPVGVRDLAPAHARVAERAARAARAACEADAMS